MSNRSEAIQRWWPATQSLDLVAGDEKHVAEAVLAEIRRFVSSERLNVSWQSFSSVDAAFRSAPSFTNVPTYFLVLPTVSPWTVLWNNSFLCDGYDSLCWCLTMHHRLNSLHWRASDEATTMQAGSQFTHRKWNGTSIEERSVYCSQNDKRWVFTQDGAPLSEEDLPLYQARVKRDRLNETRMMELLQRLGARPWAEDFYAVPSRSSFVVHRPAAPPSITRRAISDVIPDLL